jgi:cysteinyl-tRNA synthetase
MGCTLLGTQFDIHGGGQDLQFPHHENEIAQSEGAYGTDAGPEAGGRFVNYWMHNGFVRVDDAKMSKSLGNFFTVREILKLFDPEVVRFFIVRAHYRSPLNHSDAQLEDAKQGLTRLYTALKGFAGPGTVDWNEPHARRFKAAMDDDFNTPEAVAQLHLLANAVFHGNKEAASQLKGLAGTLGLLQRDAQEFLRAGPGSGPSDMEIQERIEARLAARKNRNYAEADRIRKALESSGVILEDGPQGTTWRRA